MEQSSLQEKSKLQHLQIMGQNLFISKIHEETILSLRNIFNEKYLKDFDDLEKSLMTFKGIELIQKMKTADMESFISWSMRHWETGSLAAKLNLILQQQNMGLELENEKLKEEIKTLKENISWS